MIKIMLIDDNLDVAEMFSETLTAAGFDVDVFTDASAALASIRELRFPNHSSGWLTVTVDCSGETRVGVDGLLKVLQAV